MIASLFLQILVLLSPLESPFVLSCAVYICILLNYPELSNESNKPKHATEMQLKIFVSISDKSFSIRAWCCRRSAFISPRPVFRSGECSACETSRISISSCGAATRLSLLGFEGAGILLTSRLITALLSIVIWHGILMNSELQRLWQTGFVVLDWANAITWNHCIRNAREIISCCNSRLMNMNELWIKTLVRCGRSRQRGNLWSLFPTCGRHPPVTLYSTHAFHMSWLRAPQCRKSSTVP